MFDNHELMAAVEMASRYYGTELMKGAGVGPDKARGYVANRRLFQPMVELFRVGYAPATGGPTPWILGKMGGKRRLLVAAGILNETGDGRVYDPMAGRVVFPQVNPAGKFLGFVGRDITGDGKDKYLATGSTPIFRRAEVLYRIDRARRGIERSRTVIVVEGLLDAALLFQIGVKNVVATGTKAMTDPQAQILSRYARKLEVMFDNDEKGREGFDEVRKRRGGHFETVTWKDYPGKYGDPAEWVADQIDRAIQRQEAAVVG